MGMFIPLFFFLSFLSSPITSNFSFCSTLPCDSQLLALANIANAFQNTTFLTDHWNLTKNYCSWPMVTCDILKNITILNFGMQQLMGTISPSFSKLISLEYLYLEDNDLSGVVPKSLTELPKLRVLNLSNNNISGPLPHFDTSVRVKTNGNPLLESSSSIPPPNEGNEAGNRTANGSSTKSMIPLTLTLTFTLVVLAAVMLI